MTKWTKEYRKKYNKNYSQKYKKIFSSEVCNVCGNTFTPIKINQKSCPNEQCRKKSKKARTQKYIKNRKVKDPIAFIGDHIKDSARNRNIDAPHSPLEYRNWYIQQTKKCVYCKNDNETIVKYLKKIGEKITVLQNRLHFDRIDSSKGYLLDNLVLACSICNSHRSDIICHDEFMEVAENYIVPKIKKTLNNN
jgi:hypothetical protein